MGGKTRVHSLVSSFTSNETRKRGHLPQEHFQLVLADRFCEMVVKPGLHRTAAVVFLPVARHCDQVNRSQFWIGTYAWATA